MKKCLSGLKWFILHVEEIIASVSISVMLIAMFMNVILRYVFKSPTAWASDLAMIGLAYVTFVGGAAAYKKNLHYGIEAFIDIMPVGIRMFIRRVTNFVFIFLFGYITYLGYELFSNTVKVFVFSGWSYKYMDFALPLGFFSMTIYAIYFFIQSFTDKAAFKLRYEQNYEEENVDEDLVKATNEMFEKNHREESGEK